MATERGEIKRDQGEQPKKLGNHRLFMQGPIQDKTMDLNNYPQEDSLEVAYDKKPLRSERSVMTQQPQATTSKGEFADFKNNFMVNLDESGNEDNRIVQKSPPKKEQVPRAENKDFELTIVNQLNELKAFQSNMEKELEEIMTGRSAVAATPKEINESHVLRSQEKDLELPGESGQASAEAG